MTEQGVTVRGIRNRRECRKLGPNLLLAATALKPELADQIPATLKTPVTPAVKCSAPTLLTCMPEP